MNAVDGRLWSVPRHRKIGAKGNRHTNRPFPRGTDGSNPVPSSGESDELRIRPPPNINKASSNRSRRRGYGAAQPKRYQCQISALCRWHDDVIVATGTGTDPDAVHAVSRNAVTLQVERNIIGSYSDAAARDG